MCQLKTMYFVLIVIIAPSVVAQKTLFPSAIPTSNPTGNPTSEPSAPTEYPTGDPSSAPTALPSASPVAFVAETYTGGAGNQNFTWYQPFDAQTYSAYSAHWISSHESWLYDQYDSSCKTQNTLPVCVDGKLLEDPTMSCPSNGCMATSYAVDPCQGTPLDTIDYVPPPITAEGVSAVNECVSTTENLYLLPPYYGLDSGLPPINSPLKAINLKVTGNVYGRTGDVCTSINEVKIDFWHVKTDLLSHAYNEFYVMPEEIPLERGEEPPDEMTPLALRDVSCRGEVTTSKDGEYTIHTTLPHSYGPPRHINVRISAPGYETLITRMYFDKDLRLQQLVYEGNVENNREENHDLREETLQDGLQNSFRLKESLHYGVNQVEYHEGFLHFGENMKKHLNKDPRVSEVEFVASETDYLDNRTEPMYKGRFEAKFDMILRPLRSLEDTKTSPMNAYNLTGLWRDDDTGGLVKVESDGHLFVAVEFPHIRKWGTVFGNLRGDTISGVDFRASGRQQRSANEEYAEEHMALLRKWTQSDHIWQNDYTMGRVLPTDAFHTNKDEGTIFWSNSKHSRLGYANQWHKVAFQQVYRYLKLEVSRVGGEQSSSGFNSATSGSPGGGGGGRLVINEIEFYQGFLAQTAVPLSRYKMQSPRTPSPQKVTCSSFEDNIRHCFKAFDGDFSANGSWVSDSIGLRQQRVPQNHWVMLDLGPKVGDRVFPTSLRIVCGNTVGNNGAVSPEGCPMTFTLYGSNNPLKEFDIITHVDMYDYPEMNEYGDEGGMVFNFFDDAPFGRLNGQKCGSCDSPPHYSCSTHGYDLTCKSKYCDETGVCNDSPQCPKGFYQEVHYTSVGAPELICKNCPAGKFGSISGLTNMECSGDCDEGCYCTEGATNSCQYPCLHVGSFCPKGSGFPLVAGMGQKTIDASNETNVDTTTWDEDTSQFLRKSLETTPRVATVPCSPGHYCTGGFEIPCPTGRYGNGSLLASPSCTGKCLAGTYCPSGSVIPTICPVGHYCPDGILPLKCPDGRYGSSEGLRDRACSGICPTGYYCPQGTVTANDHICPAGYFGSKDGQFNVSCSGLCKPGYYCPAGSVSETAAECGDISVYCPIGSTLPLPVSVGYYTVGGDNATRSAQKQCEPGFYCVDGEQFACPPGSFGNISGLSSLVGPIFDHINAFYCSGLCDAGHYCPFNSTSSTQEKCPAGRYGSSQGLTDNNCTAICPLGHYCPAGSIVPTKCPAGVFGGYEGLMDKNCNPECTDDLCSDQDISRSKCKAGFYCEEGSITMTHKECGGVDVYCPEGSTEPIPVDKGYYTVGVTPEQRTHQLICEVGFFCRGGVKIECPPGVYGDSLGLTTKTCTAPCPVGYYCPRQSHNGTHHRCPAGRYGSVTGLYNRVCENFCAAGYYCPEGSTSPYEKECGDFVLEVDPAQSQDNHDLRTKANAYFCPVGSPIPLLAPPGYFTKNGSSTTRSEIEECRPGTYCVDGIIRDCPAGCFGDTYKLFDPLCSGSCRRGFYCPAGSTSSTEIPCPQGTFGEVEGLTTAECSGVCQNPLACLPGSVQDMSKVFSV